MIASSKLIGIAGTKKWDQPTRSDHVLRADLGPAHRSPDLGGATIGLAWIMSKLGGKRHGGRPSKGTRNGSDTIGGLIILFLSFSVIYLLFKVF